MNTAVGARTRDRSDRRMAIVAGAGAAVSLAGFVARTAHAVPSGIASAVIVGGAGIGLRMALLFAARSSSSAARARTMRLLSTLGLALAGVSAIAILPTLTKAGGGSRFVTDLMVHLWTLGLLTLAASPIRTLGWRAFAGALLAGFLAVSGLARMVGTPVVHHFGTASVFATAVYVPVTEEVLKALLVVLIVVLAALRSHARPSALDLVLVGAWTGTGFALFEDALYGRGGAGWSANSPFSILVPSEVHERVGDSSLVAGGHLVYTALIALGLAVTVFYRRTIRRAWLAAPLAILVVLGEHAAVNSMPLLTKTGHEPLLERILAPATLGGRLSSSLLLAGVVALVVLERRAIRPAGPIVSWVRLAPAETARRMSLLAARQTGAVAR